MDRGLSRKVCQPNLPQCAAICQNVLKSCNNGRRLDKNRANADEWDISSLTRGVTW